jgi:hypothetical protein
MDPGPLRERAFQPFFGSMSKPTPARDAGFFMPSVATTKALSDEVAELLEVCRDCRVKHSKLARDTHSGMFHEARKGEPVESDEGRRIRLAKERRRTKRMIRLIQGERVPVRRSA